MVVYDLHVVLEAAEVCQRSAKFSTSMQLLDLSAQPWPLRYLHRRAGDTLRHTQRAATSAGLACTCIDAVLREEELMQPVVLGTVELQRAQRLKLCWPSTVRFLFDGDRAACGLDRARMYWAAAPLRPIDYTVCCSVCVGWATVTPPQPACLSGAGCLMIRS